jgi:hypothetical protein
MTKIALLGSAILLSVLSASIADARSCTDVLNACMRIYDVPRGRQVPKDPTVACRELYGSCMQTGVWAGHKTIKGLEKK